jgi:hypothetical protein
MKNQPSLLKFCFLTLLTAVLCAPGPVCAQVEIPTNGAPQSVFCGDQRIIYVTWRNAADEIFTADVRLRLWQTSSATATQLADIPWKTLEVLPRQTVLESAHLNFPPVKAGTTFLVQWLAGSNHLLGTTEVTVYATNLLDELKPLLGDHAQDFGVLDPHRQIRTALNHAGIKFTDLGETGLADFSGRLALVGPCRPDDMEWDGLAGRISQLALKGTPVIWIQAAPSRQLQLTPSFYLVPKNETAVVVVEPGLVADLPDNPQSQLNLIHFCQLALQPKPFHLPELTPQP